MRVAVASFEFEGNSLSPRRDGRADFTRKGMCEGAAVLAAASGKRIALSGGIDTLAAAGAEVVPLLLANGGTGGCVTDEMFAYACDVIVAGAAAAGPWDGVYLALHGAMITETDGDPEGTLLTALRQALGPAVPVAVSLDLHAHVTEAMVEAADIVCGYETYPHVDAYETGAKAAALLVRTMRGEIRPAMALAKLNALLPVLGMATLGDAPMAEVAAASREMERRGVLSVSYFPVQPWLDGADVGIAGLAVTDGDTAAAEAAATAVADAMWTRRARFLLPAFTPEDAVAEALNRPERTVLLVDGSDAIGGGAAGDEAAVLAALLALAPGVPAAVSLVGAAAVAQAAAAGEGARAVFTLGVQRLAVEAEVVRLADGRFTYDGGPFAGAEATIGPAAVLQAGAVTILVGSHAVYEHTDEHYRAAGIDIGACRMAAFKQLMNFRKLLSADVGFVPVHGPGATPLDLTAVAWNRRVRPFWPADAMAEPPRLPTVSRLFGGA
ncbi:M81 family metallopeptidase [Acuticoccus yangtzensis]|uniref:M81 family metallopeptidase n=1 Tax=Acuticoccus yangtzensis TaxID=1443441 RepID=UPI0009499DE1|nr:M81 family metallopeptidase [Acuticoccus yangtzensis]